MQTKSLQKPAWMPSRRSRTRISQLWQVPTFLMGLATLVLVTCGAVLQQGKQDREIERNLSQLRRLLEAEKADLQKALRLAETVVDQSGGYPQRAGEAHLLLGTVMLRLGDTKEGKKAIELRTRARAHLEQSEVLGVAPEDRKKLWYRLGTALYHTNGDPKQIISYLARSLPQGTRNPGVGYGRLVQTYLRLHQPDLDAALVANQEQIRLATDNQTIINSRLQRGELLIRKKLYSEAVNVLTQISSDAPREILLRALYLQAFAAKEEKLWNKGISLWEKLLQSPNVVPGGERQIYYTLGLCYRNATPPENRNAEKAWLKTEELGGKEGQAASFHLAKLYLFRENKNIDRAITQIKKALVTVTNNEKFKNRFFPLEEVLQFLELSIDVALEEKAFGSAQELTQEYKKIASPGVGEIRFADVSHAWADFLDRQATKVNSGLAKDLHDRAYYQWRNAALAYEEALPFVPDESKPDLFWKSIQCYRQAGDQNNALRLLTQYVQIPISRERQARGWFEIALARKAKGQVAQARQDFFKCIEYDDTEYAAKARLQLALEKIEQNDFDEAEKILRQILQITSPETGSEGHEEALYKLATLLYQQKNYSQAYLKLKEATNRYPDNPEVFLVRDMLGDCYRKLAGVLNKELTKIPNPLPANVLADLRKKRMEWLGHARQTYQKLSDDLLRKKASNRLTYLEGQIYRKATFATADVIFDMNDFQESLRRYQKLAGEHRKKLEELIACQRIWRCCASMVEPTELQESLQILKSVLKSAEITLAGLPEESFQGPPGTWTREDWQSWMREVKIQVKTLPSRVNSPE